MNATRKMRSRDLIRICLRREPSGPDAQAAPAPRDARRPADWPVTRNVDVDASGCSDLSSVETGDSSPPVEGEADSDPPSPGRTIRCGTIAGALVLGGALLLGLSASPAAAQDSGTSDGGTSGSMSSGVGSSSMSSGVSSSDGGGMSSSSDGGGSSSGMGRTSDGGMSSGGCCGSDGSMSSSFSSSGYGGDAGVSSDAGYGSTYTSNATDSTSFSSDAGVSSDAGYGSIYSTTSAETSTYSGETGETGYSSTTRSVSPTSDTSEASSYSTGFEGSSEVGPGHAEAVNTDSSTWSGSTDTSPTGFTDTEGLSYSTDADTDTGLTGFEGSSEVGPGHAAAVTTDAPTWTGDVTPTGFEGSPEIGPEHAEAVNTESATWGPDPTPTGFEGSSEVGPGHAAAVNTSNPTWTGDDTPTGFESSPEVSAVHAAAVAAQDPSWTGDLTPTGFESSSEVGPGHAQAVLTNAATWTDATPTGFESSSEVGPGHVEGVNLQSPEWTGEPDLTGFERSPELGPVLAQDMLDAELLGRYNAENVRQALRDVGLNPDRFSPNQLRSMFRSDRPAYTELSDAIRDLTEGIRNPLRGDDRIASPYAARTLETLDTEGTRAVVGAINQYAYDRSLYGVPDVNVRTEMMDPMAAALALATESPIAPLDTFEGLRDVQSRWQQHQLGQLLNAGYTYDAVTHQSVPTRYSYDPAHLARFADAVLGFGRADRQGVYRANPDNPQAMASRYYGLDALNPIANPASLMDQGTEAWDGDPFMQVPAAIAQRALADDPEASYEFAGIRRENMRSLVRPAEGLRGVIGLTREEAAQVRGLMDQYGLTNLRQSMFDAVAADPSRFESGLDRLADFTREMGVAPVGNPVRQAYADLVSSYFTDEDGRVRTYIDAIGQAGLRQRATRYGNDAEGEARRAAQDFARPDLVKAWSEVGQSREAADILGQTMVRWSEMRTRNFLDDDNVTLGEAYTALRPPAMVLDTMRQGFDKADHDAAYKAFAEGVKKYGSYYAAAAGPVANSLAATPPLAFLAGLSGSLAWAGTTYMDGVTKQPPNTAIHGDDFSRVLADTLRENMTTELATRRGELAPAPENVQPTLDAAMPDTADPFDHMLDLSATERSLNTRDGTHWGSR